MHVIDTFFTILKKSLVLTVFLVFGFVTVYTPQPANPVPEVEAGGIVLDPTNLVQNTLTAVSTAVSAIADQALWIKEYVLDNIAWILVKGIVSGIVADLIDWVNTGYRYINPLTGAVTTGSAFAQDLQGYLLSQTDITVERLVGNLQGPNTFLCNPNNIDVPRTVARIVERSYELSRDIRPVQRCNLGIFQNYEQFVGGDFSQGGWDDWLDIVENPEYTTLGQINAGLEAARRDVLNTEFEEISQINQGDGILPVKVCGTGNSPTFGSILDCFVATPGKVIVDSLGESLDSGRESLVVADELNELLASLLSGLSNTAITGASGLLGLSSGGFTGGLSSGGGGSTGSAGLNFLTDARADQVAMRTTAQNYFPCLDSLANSPDTSIDQQRKDAARDSANNITNVIIPRTNSNITTLDALIAEWPNATPERQQQIINTANSLPLYSSASASTAQSTWSTLLNLPTPFNCTVGGGGSGGGGSRGGGGGPGGPPIILPY